MLSQVKRVDDLGRVAIPKEMRLKLGIEYGDEVEVAMIEKANAIIIHVRKKEE